MVQIKVVTVAMVIWNKNGLLCHGTKVWRMSSMLSLHSCILRSSNSPRRAGVHRADHKLRQDLCLQRRPRHKRRNVRKRKSNLLSQTLCSMESINRIWRRGHFTGTTKFRKRHPSHQRVKIVEVLKPCVSGSNLWVCKIELIVSPVPTLF